MKKTAPHFPAFSCCALAASLAFAPLLAQALAQGGGEASPPAAQPGPYAAYLNGQQQSPACPEAFTAVYRVAYPQGTGSPLADLVIANFARSLEGGFLTDTLNPVLGARDLCDDKFVVTMETGYEISVPSAGHLSVVFTAESYAGGAHPARRTSVLNFQGGGFLLDIAYLFPGDRDAGIDKFWGGLYRVTCAAGKGTMPSFYGGHPCQGDDAPPAGAFRDGVKEVADLGNLSFTPGGATVHLDPYDGWSWADGPQEFAFTKGELIGMGANPAVWGR
ncbi:MAG: hypothetical protein LBG06_12205 [Deltaproteobacteria bacterium]|jgi:hypothetical protein|nr:hypothetical protein [Deltaproteobacteria bacterium]